MRLNVNVFAYINFDQNEALWALKIAIEKDKGKFLKKLLDLINPDKRTSFLVYVMEEYSRLGPGSSFGELALKHK